MWYDSFYVSMLSEKYKTGKSNILKAFITGSVSNMKAMLNTEKCSSVIYVAHSYTSSQENAKLKVNNSKSLQRIDFKMFGY